MKTDQYGQIIYNEEDLCDLVMQGHDLNKFDGLVVEEGALLESAITVLENIPTLLKYNNLENISISEFDRQCQNNWFMPIKYKDLDIAEHVLGLCKTDAELQRCGHELMLFQERNLFNLLRYLVFLVDLMRDNCVIWGVGRGSSVASYVLYKLGVHRVDSLYYDLDPHEFLR